MKKGLKRIGLGALLLALGLAGSTAQLTAKDQDEPRSTPVRIGMVGSLFRDQPPALVMALMKPFGSVMKAQTGVPGELVPGGDHFQMAQMLINDEIQLAVLHGVEFAWVRAKHPELQPLMIAVSTTHHIRCNLIVNCDCKAEGFGCLKGSILALPKGTREHVRLFMKKHCQSTCNLEPSALFQKITVPATIEDALDEVVDGEVGATLIDEVALEAYKRRKPGRCERLKTITQSEVFPSGAIVYHPGHLDEATLQKFREGMLNADKTILGKQMLMMWKLTGFEPVPQDYDETLTNILKLYPAPESERSASK